MSLNVEIAAKYAVKHDTFVETGTNNGDGVQIALDAGFKNIISIEFYPKAFARASKRFESNENVEILNGDSAEMLDQILLGLSPSCFWLDAHFMSGMEVKQPLTTPCPVLKELKAIANQAVNDHTIMVDDIRIFRQGIPLWSGINLPQIEAAVKTINPDYKISFADSSIAKNDILIAEV